MNDWFRSWHGAPTDPKWLVIAKRANTIPAIVSAIVWALFDHASQRSDASRGETNAFDQETYSLFSGVPEETVAAVIAALTEKGLIKDGRLTAWEKRQPKREDGSAERSKEWRERKRTQANANEHREDKIREEKKDAADAAPAVSKTDEAAYFDRAKAVLKDPKGGMAAQLFRAKGKNVALARSAIEMAATKSNPREYVGAIIRGADPPERTVDPRL